MNLNNLYLEIKNEIGRADTKLGMRITMLGVWITSISIILIHYNIKLWIIFLVISIYLIQAFVASIAIFPKLGNKKKWNYKNNTYKNEYYFEYIASFKNENHYIEHLKNLKNIKIFENDLAKQIYINSCILKRKYNFYKYSSFLWVFCDVFLKIIKIIKNFKYK